MTVTNSVLMASCLIQFISHSICGPILTPEEKTQIIRRLGLLPDSNRLNGIKATDIFDLIDLDMNQMHIDEVDENQKPNSRKTRAVHHGHGYESSARSKHELKSRDGYKNAAYYHPSVRRPVSTSSSSFQSIQEKTVLSKRTGQRTQHTVINRQVRKVLPISTRTRQARLRNLEFGI